jgi:hypothetical protein
LRRKFCRVKFIPAKNYCTSSLFKLPGGGGGGGGGNGGTGISGALPIFAGGGGGGTGGLGMLVFNLKGGEGGMECFFCEKILVEMKNAIATPDKYIIDFLIK